MSIRQKLIVLLILPAMIIAWSAYDGVRRNATRLNEMSRVKRMMELTTSISSLIHETQKERGMTAGFLGSKGKNFASELTNQRKVVDERREVLLKEYASFNTKGMSPGFLNSIDSALGDLERMGRIRSRVSSQTIALGEALGYYTKFNGDMLDTIGKIALETNDTEVKQSILKFMLFLKGKERAGIERAVLANTFSKDMFGPGMFVKFAKLVDQQNTYFHEFELIIKDGMVDAFAELKQHDSFRGVQSYRDIAFSKSKEGGFGQDPKKWFAMSTGRINALKDFEDELGASLIALADKFYKQSMAMTTMYCLFAVLSLLIPVISMWLIRSILRPLRSMMTVLEQAKKDADLTARAEASRRDEIGHLARNFNAFVDRVQNLIIDVRRATNDVAAASTEIVSSAEEIASNMSQTESQVQSMNSLVKDASSSVDQVVDQSRQASESAKASGQVAQQGGSTVEHTIVGMQEIHETVAQSAKSVEQLGKRGEEIGVVITVINDIADQTNLLALNAAIEAARAGEHGRGFAVVADEVRKLADRTTKATQEISESISTIQAETERAVTGMEAGTKQVQQGVEAASQAGESLKQIVGSTNEVACLIEGITNSADHQHQVSYQLNEGISEISAVATQAAAGTQQAAAAAQQLSTQCHSLYSMLNQFKTREDRRKGRGKRENGAPERRQMNLIRESIDRSRKERAAQKR